MSKYVIKMLNYGEEVGQFEFDDICEARNFYWDTYYVGGAAPVLYVDGELIEGMQKVKNCLGGRQTAKFVIPPNPNKDKWP